jgi:Derlin-2/3
MDQFLAEIRKIPPVTRFICGSSLGVTGSVILGAVAPYTVLFVKDFVFKKLQVYLFLIFAFIFR